MPRSPHPASWRRTSLAVALFAVASLLPATASAAERTVLCEEFTNQY